MRSFRIHMEGRDSQEIAAEKLTILEAMQLLGVKGLERVVAAKVNNENKDLSYFVETESHLEPIFIDQEEGLEILRHSASHVMAMAVKEGRANGFHCIEKPAPAKAFDGKKICWLFSKTYGLVELLESDDQKGGMV